METFIEYGVLMTKIKEACSAHADMMLAKEYTSVEDYRRDFAQGIELYQRYIDLLGEMIDDSELLPLSEYVSMV
jgi:hypothetical protein